MRINIMALGSRGDVQPFVPLGRALQSAGHTVKIATFSLFESMVRRAGLDFHYIRGDAKTLVRTAAGGGLLNRNIDPVRAFRALKQSYGQLTKTLPEDIARLNKCDLILNQLPASLFGIDLADHYGVPWAIVTVIPLTRTSARPLIGFPQALAFLPGYNALTYRVGEQIGWQLFRKAVNDLRENQWGLPPHPLFGPYGRIYTNEVPVICGFSKHVVPREPDWGDNVQMTGWWHPNDPHWAPPAKLVNFLKSGPRPVFIGFGSMPIRKPERALGLIINALRISDQRAVLHSGWADLSGELPKNIYGIDYASYDWLFPRMVAVVHHGGSGTSGSGFRAGVPSIILPFGFDQFYWGKRAAQLGVGPKPIPFEELSAERLAKTIRSAVSDRELIRQASKLGDKLRKENGISRAVEIIESLQ